MGNTYRWTAFGEYYGFPVCCVKEFLATCCQPTKERYPQGPWVGTGFIPCEACAEKALDFDNFVAENIAPTRFCETPFPDDGPDDVVDVIIELAEARAEAQVEPKPRLVAWFVPIVRLATSRLLSL